MKNDITPNRKFQCATTYIVFTFFLFSTFFSGIPGVPVSLPEARAQTDITYITSYGYDDNGNVTSRTTPNNDIINYTYDKLNRLTKITYPDLSEVSHIYDANGNRTEMTDSHGTTYYSFDQFNRLRAVQYSGIVPVYYDYDKAGNITKTTYPTGEEISYAYDNDNRLISVTDYTGTTTYEYDNQTNNLYRKTLPNGVYTDVTYDLAKRVTDVVNRKSDSSLISSYHYDYDENNNITHIDEITTQGTKTIDYTYDDLNRLTNASYSDGSFETYTYDSSGNRLTKTTQSGTINYEYDKDNRLLKAGNTIFFYDNSGNLIKKMTPDKTVDYTYDYENRLIQYTDGSNTVTFEYDGDGNRISKSVNGVKTKYVNHMLSPITQVLLETTAQDQVTNRYSYGFSRLNQLSQSSSYYIYNKPARSVTALVDNSESVINNYEYGSFGNIKTNNETLENSFKYVGEQYDEETGLIYLRNRYYDPEIGRFITKDPFPGYVRAPQTGNPYPYVGNNPVNRIDPLGLTWGESLGMFWNWATGTGPEQQTFGPGSNQVKDMMDAPGVNRAREYFYNKNASRIERGEPLKEITDFDVAFGLKGLWQAGLDPTEQFVGSYKVDVFPNQNGTMTFELSNTTSMTSFLYGMGPSWDRSTLAPGGNMSQTYTWTEPIAKPVYNDFSSFNYAFSDYGGVSLSKTADLMLNINDIAGATYDDATGQVILFGKQDVSLPAMDLDDLSVAVRSVYGYGGEDPQDPGVSIGTEPSGIPGEMLVRYDGQTFDTEFGWVMFESDRTLKNLSLGKDNITGATMSSGVPGYKNMLTRYREAGSGYLPDSGGATRMWFVPKEIALGQSDDDTSMIFNIVTMELLTESKFQDNIVTDVIAEQFADHFTQNYDNFAASNEFPILKDLKRLGKITSVVKWIRDNNIPFDLSFFENYTPEAYSTPQYTPEITVSETWTEGSITHTLSMTGGVAYRLDDSNFTSSADPAADQTKQDALAARPVETDFNWNFSSGGQDYEAVAHSMTRSRKDGSIKRTEMDMSFPVEGNNPLSLMRFYNSFNDKSTGFGFGWDMLPYKLRFPADKWLFTFGGQSITVDAYYQIFVTENGSEHLYTLSGLDTNELPVYERDGGQYIMRDNMDGTYTLLMKNRGTVSFDSQRRITRMTDNNGLYIDYNYSGSNLASISHQGGRTITLNYTGNNITSAVGPGSKTIYYTYDGSGNLETVKNELNETVTYSYDTDRRLSNVVDPRGNTVFQAGFDDYNRASSQTIGSSANYSSTFSLADRMSTITDPNSVTTTQYFDADYRITNLTDSLGRQMDITYDANDFGPATVTDPNSNTTEYQYDAAGNVIYMKDAENGERRLFYDYNNNPVIARDARSYDTAYVYDANDRLIEIRHDVTADTDVYGELTGSHSYNPAFVTTLTYDPANGNLLSITDPDGRVQNITYDGNGMPLTTARFSGYQTTNTYDSRSRLENISNAGGEYVTYGYNGADRITTITTPAGTITYTYDANGNIDIVYDALNNPTDYDYDANNNLVRVTDAENGVTDYEYDIVNNLLTRIILPNGTIKEIEYDELNRPIREIFRITNPSPKPAVVIDSLDVGSTIVGSSTQQQLSVCNVGNETVTMTDASTDNANFTVNTTTAVILPGECFDLQITFTGTAIGSESGLLTLTFDDSSIITVTLTAEVVLESLNATAVSEVDGIRVSWSQYPGAGTFDHYNVYCSDTEITDISGLTPIATFTNLDDSEHLDTNVVIGDEYHYCVIAFDPDSNMLTAIESVGPVTFLNLGRKGSKIYVADSTKNEKAVAMVYNSALDEYLLVYEYDYSGNETDYDIIGQRVSWDGLFIDSSFPVIYTGYDERNPKIAYNSTNNEYMVIAERDSDGTGHYQIRAQRISTTGALVGSPVDILSTTAIQRSAGIAYNSTENKYLVVFENDYTEDGREDFLRIALAADGSYLSGYVNSGSGDARLRNPRVDYNTALNEYFAAFEYTNNSTYSDIVGQRLDTGGGLIGGMISIFAATNMSSYPDVTYVPERDEYAVTLNYDYYGDGSQYESVIRRVSSTGVPGSWASFSIAGESLLWPDLDYFAMQDEYLLTFTHLTSGGEYNVHAQRISAVDLSLLTEATIGIATASSKKEQKSYVVYNDARQEFLVGYEYEYGPSDWDVRAQRVGNIVENVSITPDTLDFGTALTQQDIQVDKTSGESYMHLVNYTDQSWLFVTPGNVWVYSSNPSTTLTVTVDRSNLAVGSYAGNVYVYSDGVSSTVPVTVDVANTAPSAPANPLPSDGASDQADLGYPLTVTMNWDCNDPNFGDTLTYDVYFSDNQTLVNNADPSVLVVDDGTSASYQSPTLQYETTYYWRVEAKDSFGLTTLGDVWSFTTSSIPAPDLIEQTPDPTNDTRPTLGWNIVQDAQKYHIQVDDNPDFSSPIVDDNNVFATSYPLGADLPEGTIYWRVASIDNQGSEGNYSAADDFIIDITTPGIPTPTAYTPDPTNNQRPTLTWPAVTDAVNYHIQVSSDAGFLSLLKDTYVSVTSYTAVSDLPEGAIYWRLSSIDVAGNESGFSSPDSFDIDITAPAQITGLGAVPEGNDTRLTWSQFVDTDGDFDKFNIYRSSSPIVNVSQLTPLSQLSGDPDITTYLDTTATPGELYFYATTAVDNAGNENKNVIDISNSAPTADFTASPRNGTAPLTVNFYNNSTGYDQPLTYQWDFENNGSTDSTIQNPTNIYNIPGTYSVKLTTMDSDGGTNTLTRTDYITVCNPDYVKKIGATTDYYPTILDAYNAADDGDTIQVQTIVSTGDLNLNRNISITLEGGYKCDFSSVTGETIINGNLTISDGTVIIENIKLE